MNTSVCVVHMCVHGTHMQLCKESGRRMLGWSTCRYVCIGVQVCIYVCVSMWEVHTYVHAYLHCMPRSEDNVGGICVQVILCVNYVTSSVAAPVTHAHVSNLRA